MIHRIEINPRSAASRLQVGDVTLQRGEVLEVATEDLTFELLLNGMLSIDAQDLNQRLGKPAAKPLAEIQTTQVISEPPAHL